MPLGKRLFATAFVTLMLTVFFVGLAEPADAVADTGTITLSGGEINLDVQPGSSAAVAIPGTVEMVGMSYQVTITLSASSLLGAAASVSPSAIVLPQGETMGSFTVMVKERIGTSYTSADVITVSGTWTSGKGTSGTLPATEQQIYIKQFYRITVSSEQPYVEVSPGDQVFFPMKIENMGNGQDTFVVKVEEENLKSLADAGWTVQIGTPKIVVEELQHKPTTITATTPMGSTIWKNEVQMITIMVSSENSGGGVKEEYSFYVRQHGMHIPGFDPTFAIISLALVGAVIMRKRTQGSDDEEYLI